MTVEGLFLGNLPASTIKEIKSFFFWERGLRKEERE